MKTKKFLPAALGLVFLALPACRSTAVSAEKARARKDARMKWWREARFGMFIHWGLYAVPAGEWKGKTHYAEWIRNSAHIPLKEYEKFLKKFNPTKFDARRWVRLAKRAGMKYIVITSKHHDGFCNWPSKYTDWDIESTPFKRDILGELAAACRAEGIKFGLYYSIMDWHHPDYLPRRSWEKKDRPAGGADMDRYVRYMKNQLAELIRNYHPAVLWFDGEWESTWTHERGVDLYHYVRSLDPDIIINNRVDKGRKGMIGMTKEGEYLGDFGTPEQRIPPKGLPGVDWETCMTMNRHWGYNKHDKDFKSVKDLVRKLADIASKGGNFLLNVGPRADGTFPPECVERLEGIGRWMDVNGESIYGTRASVLDETPWGRCTVKSLPGGKTRLYLHVFERPGTGRVHLPGFANKIDRAFLLADRARSLPVEKGDYTTDIALPAKLPSEIDTVVALDLEGAPRILYPDPYHGETKAQRDARMRWWREARFGMFIHWGVYAVLGGVYKGKKIPGIGEWIMYKARIPVKEYKAYARRFNPVLYDPDSWVRLAKEAGMKYIVITSKHHDGFALFDSKVTDWDMVDATPYHKDLLKPLAAACRKQGIKLGFYYSQAQDWNHPGGARARDRLWDPAQKGDMDEYIDKIAVPQVREILSNYGPVAILWWDTPVHMTRERADRLLPLLRLQPGILYNNRLGGGYKGDFSTPEQRIPATGLPGVDWETCMTMNRTWGYKSWDNNWKSTKTLIRNLVDIASKGGNYLLNVGPKPDGTFPAPIVERLKGIGRWMKVNGEAIYATKASPCRRPSWGRITRKALPGGNTRLYLHVFELPEDSVLRVPLANKVLSCRLLAEPGRAFEVKRSPAGLAVKFTGSLPDPICSVVVLDVRGDPEAVPFFAEPGKDGRIHLRAADARIHNPGGGGGARYEKGGVKDNIGYWTDPRSWVEWRFRVPGPGTWRIEVLAGNPSGGNRLRIEVGGKRFRLDPPVTGSYDKYRRGKAGTVSFGRGGFFKLAVKPVKKGWHALNLREVRLVPVRR